MRSTLANLFDKAVEFLFYGLFLLVPIVFTDKTSELFEFNKMWLTFAITTLIVVFWVGSMVLKRQVRIQRTPLDIPILLFLASQLISTIFSIDTHVSIWGYYSRFNGGFLSILTYVILYYAFVSNFVKKGPKNENKLDTTVVKRSIFVSIFSGVLVALWGLPSHFGYDPTCWLFRGKLDVACWTADFQPKVRIFSSMGQPDWLSAYLAILLPLSLTLFIKNLNLSKKLSNLVNKENLIALIFLLVSILFYIDLIFTGSKSGFIAFCISMLALASVFIVKQIRKRDIKSTLKSKGTLTVIVLLAITFLVGTPIPTLNKFDASSILSSFNTQKTTVKQVAASPSPEAPVIHGELGGTDSGKIRLIVWEGAIEAFKNNPIFGTGVETFAFAYYKYKPAAHNLTSEWNFLYNKAHNEFLNYLATTGIVGLGTYLLVLFAFLYIGYSLLFNLKLKPVNIVFEKLGVEYKNEDYDSLLVAALLASFISIIITNFFGFSVVITNIYLLLIPAFGLILLNQINPTKIFGKASKSVSDSISIAQWLELAVLAVAGFYILYFLFNSWTADTNYSLGMNLDRVNEYQQAYPYLHKAAGLWPEPVYRDELSVNDAALASLIISQTKDPKSQDITIAQNLAQEAVSTNNTLTDSYPNNIIYWKSKVRIYYTLAQVNNSYLPLALQAIKKASDLAPTDASIFYNLGVISGQSGDSKAAVKYLEETVTLKPDYGDAHYALGLFYHDLSVDKSGKVINKNYQDKAIAQMKYLLYLNSSDQRAKDSLAAWNGK